MCSVEPAGDGVRRQGSSVKVGGLRSSGTAGAVKGDSLLGWTDGVDGGKLVIRK